MSCSGASGISADVHTATGTELFANESEHRHGAEVDCAALWILWVRSPPKGFSYDPHVDEIPRNPDVLCHIQIEVAPYPRYLK
jgi:hypothetical protein